MEEDRIDFLERWGFYGDKEINVRELTEKEFRELLEKVLSDYEKRNNTNTEYKWKKE